MVFQFDPEKLGVRRFVGRAVRFEEMTAQDFDAMRGTQALSEKIGPDAAIMYLEVENIETTEATNRSCFFTPDMSPVSKWTRFIRALDNLGVRLSGPQDLVGRVFVWEEKQVEMGKYGTRNMLEPVDLVPPDELAALAEKVAAKVEKVEEAKPVAPDLESIVLSVADGLTYEELVEELEGIGVSTTGLKDTLRELIKAGKLSLKERKYRVS